MKINIEQLQRAGTEYFNKEILVKASGWKKFTTDLAFNLYKARLTELLNQLADKPLIKYTGVIDENHFIDIDTLYVHAKESIQKSGQFEFAGIIFNEADLDKLYEYIKNTTQGG